MWNKEELKQLREITNHRIDYDGYEFVWMHKLDGKWKRHYVRNFPDYNQPMSWIYYCISIWNKDYNKMHKRYIKDMKRNLDIEIKITEISREANSRTKDKVNEILRLKPSMSSRNIADVLGVTIRTVERHRNN